MKRFAQQMLSLCALLALLTFSTGCVRTQSLSKAPVTPLILGKDKDDSKQIYALRRLKWAHNGSHGQILGANYFTDTKFPIAGARIKDTFTISSAGAYQGVYTITKVIRIRTKKKRRVILKVTPAFQGLTWKNKHTGSGGLVTTRQEGDRKVQLFTDKSSFLPDVPLGSLVTVGGQSHTVVRSTVVKVAGTKLQRVAYEVEPPLPSTLQSASYTVKIPGAGTEKLKYKISWRGSSVTGYNYTIGIYRRRYTQQEIEDVLKSEDKSRTRLQGVPGKQGAATVLLVTGGVTLVIGGFLALVRRDDFQGAAVAVPWGIVGGGVLLLGISIPINISANNDFMAAAKAYNDSLRGKLKLEAADLPQAKAKPSKLPPNSHSSLPAVGKSK